MFDETNNIHLITYADKNYRWAAKLLFSEARSSHLFNHLHCYTPCEIKDFLSDKWIAKKKRGAGYWIWKPYIALLELEKMGDGDILVYVDAGCSIKNTDSWRKYLDILHDKDAIFMHFDTKVDYGFIPTVRCWTKKKAIDFFTLPNRDNSWVDKPQFISGCFLLKKSPATVRFIKEWSDFMNSHQELVCDTTDGEEIQDSAFVEHRHDQAILSLLLYTKDDNNFKYLPEEIEWHDYCDNNYRAVIASRRSDLWIKKHLWLVIKKHIKNKLKGKHRLNIS